jgi:shikimate dehydrogenase
VTQRIDGRTRLAGVVGWPLDHTLSPAMHNAAYESMGLNWTYLPLSVADETSLVRFVSAAKVLPFVGFNVTMPYKRTMVNLCDEVAAMAELAGAVNTVHVVDGRLIGYNTDGRGLLESLEAEAGFSPEGKSVALIGSGGAAGAALVGMILGRAASVCVVNRTLDKAAQLVRRVSARARNIEISAVMMDADAEPHVAAADLIVNCTPLGMKSEDPLPVQASWLKQGQIVADMVYRPAETPLLAAARQHGATAVGGLGMLVGQGAIALEIWESLTQQAAPRDVMRQAAESVLAEMDTAGSSSREDG